MSDSKNGSYRWASVVRLTMDDPVNDHMEEGTETIVAGRCEDGISHTVFDPEARGDFVRIECEVLQQYHAESRMTRDDIVTWAVEKARGDVWPTDPAGGAPDDG